MFKTSFVMHSDPDIGMKLYGWSWVIMMTPFSVTVLSMELMSVMTHEPSMNHKESVEHMHSMMSKFKSMVIEVFIESSLFVMSMHFSMSSMVPMFSMTSWRQLPFFVIMTLMSLSKWS